MSGENDTVKLLKECNSGSKMAVASIDEVMDKLCNVKLKQLLTESKAHHTKLGNEIHAQLTKLGCKDEEPNPIAKGMSWLKTNVKLTVESGDDTVADLMTDGCNMGIKSLFKYLNQYRAAEPVSKDLCNRLIGIEEQLRRDLRVYL